MNICDKIDEASKNMSSDVCFLLGASLMLELILNELRNDPHHVYSGVVANWIEQRAKDRDGSDV